MSSWMRTTSLLAVAIGAVLGIRVTASGQVPALLLSSETGPPLGEVTAQVSLSHTMPIRAWSFCVCHPTSELTALAAEPSSNIAMVHNGDGPDFLSIYFVPGGIATQCLLSFSGTVILPSGTQPLLDIDYRIESSAGTTSALSICSGLGPPAYPSTSTMLDPVGGPGIVPSFGTGTVTSSFAVPTFILSIPSITISFDPSTGNEDFSVAATIGEHPSSPGAPNSAFGFSLAIAHDALLLDAIGAAPLGVIAALNGGQGPDFLGVTPISGGLTIGVVFSFAGVGTPVTFPTATPVMELEYSTNEATLEGELSTIVTELDWRSGLGEPPVANVVVHDLAGNTSFVVGVNGNLTLVPIPEIFVRGDCTANGAYDLGDPIRLLGYLFSAGAALDCEDACDGNDDGTLNIADVVAVLSHLFAGGSPPAAPYPNCNTDPTGADALDCDLFAPCP